MPNGLSKLGFDINKLYWSIVNSITFFGSIDVYWYWSIMAPQIIAVYWYWSMFACTLLTHIDIDAYWCLVGSFEEIATKNLISSNANGFGVHPTPWGRCLTTQQCAAPCLVGLGAAPMQYWTAIDIDQFPSLGHWCLLILINNRAEIIAVYWHWSMIPKNLLTLNCFIDVEPVF